MSANPSFAGSITSSVMRTWGLSVCLIFPGEGIGKIRIEQHMNPLPLQQEPALSQPPQTETAVATIRRMNIAKQRIVGA